MGEAEVSSPQPLQRSVRVLGRYELHDPIASGGMATVHIGRLLGPVGFSRTVAIKRLHSQFARDPEFVSMFLDEARLAAKIRHPNVIPTLDVVALADEIFLVMEYVEGESLGRLVRLVREQGVLIPPPIVAAILSQALQGLHAAHEARDNTGRHLAIVHRDVSPQNILVGVDGVARVLDFGVAKAASRVHETRSGEIEGKLAYMAPEQIRGGSATLTRAVDIYASGIVLWEALAGKRLFKADTEAETLYLVLTSEPPPLRSVAPSVSEALEAVAMKALQREPQDRFESAEEMAVALSAASPIASQIEVARWVRSIARDSIAARAARVAEIERSSGKDTTKDVDALIGRLGVAGKSDAEIDVMLDTLKPPAPEGEVSQIATQTVPSSAVRAGRRPLAATWIVAAVLVLAGVVLALARRAAPGPAAAEASSRPSASASAAELAASPSPVVSPPSVPASAALPAPSTQASATAPLLPSLRPAAAQPSRPAAPAKPAVSAKRPALYDHL